MKECAKRLECTTKPIRRRLIKQGVHIRTGQSYKRLPVSKERLSDLYISQKKSARQCAKILNTDTSTITACLRRHEIPIRGHGEATRLALSVPEVRAKLKEKWQDPEVSARMIANIREGVRRVGVSPERREMARKLMRRNLQDPEFQKKRLAGLWGSPQVAQKLREYHRTRIFPAALREKARQQMIKNHQDPEFERKRIAGVVAAMMKFPTTPERMFADLVSDNIRYIGNGSYWRQITLRLSNGEYIRKYKNPDFKIAGKNKVIEIYGDYWHRNDIPEDLIMAYKEAGIECIVIWEHEIYEDIEGVLNRVAAFVGDPEWQLSLSL